MKRSPLERLKTKVVNTVHSGHKPKKVDESLYDDIQHALGDGKLLRVSPYPDNDGIEASEDLLQALHNLRTSLNGLKNVSDSHSYEMWYDEGKLQFLFYVTDERTETKLRAQIKAHYPNANITEEHDLFPEIYDGDYVAGSELTLKRSKYYPVKNTRGVRNFNADPYRSITSDMITDHTDRTLVQIVFRPAHHSWAEGGVIGKFLPFQMGVKEVADNLKGEQLLPGIRVRKRDPTSEERSLAQKIAEQEGLPAYHMNVRVVSFSQNKKTARENAWTVSKAFEQSYREAGGQQLVQDPKRGSALDELVRRTARREWVDHDMILTIPEVASIAHIPNESIETPSVDWNQTQSGARVPADAEQFDDAAIPDHAPGKADDKGNDMSDGYGKTLSEENDGLSIADVAIDDEEETDSDESEYMSPEEIMQSPDEDETEDTKTKDSQEGAEYMSPEEIRESTQPSDRDTDNTNTTDESSEQKKTTESREEQDDGLPDFGDIDHPASGASDVMSRSPGREIHESDRDDTSDDTDSTNEQSESETQSESPSNWSAGPGDTRMSPDRESGTEDSKSEDREVGETSEESNTEQTDDSGSTPEADSDTENKSEDDTEETDTEDMDDLFSDSSFVDD